MYIGAQMYTVRKFAQTADDLRASIEKVAAIGYKYVQISGVGDDIPAGTIRKICDDNGVKIIITHVDKHKLLTDLDELIEAQQIMGAPYMGLGSMPFDLYPETVDGVNRFIEDFHPIAEAIKSAGLAFTYHNHNFELEKIGGKLLFDRLTDGFGADLMKFVIDTYWVQMGGGDPAYWLEKLKGRVPVIHLKDFAFVNHEQRMAEILEGNLNWPRIFDACANAGVQYAFVEQDDTYDRDPFDSLKISFANLGGTGEM